jgi:hypothetical protein
METFHFQPAHLSTSAPLSSASLVSSRTKEVLLVSLDKTKEHYNRRRENALLLKVLQSKVLSLNTITDAKMAGEYIRYYPFPNLVAVIVTDSLITRTEHEPEETEYQKQQTYPAIEERRYLSECLVEYVRNKGGIVILGCHWGWNYVTHRFDHWINNYWGLDWKLHREEGRFGEKSNYLLSPSTHERFWDRRYWEELKDVRLTAVFLNGVEQRDRVYSSYGAVAAAAFTKQGEGWLRWIGDRGILEDSVPLFIAMCGL